MVIEVFFVKPSAKINAPSEPSSFLARLKQNAVTFQKNCSYLRVMRVVLLTMISFKSFASFGPNELSFKLKNNQMIIEIKTHFKFKIDELFFINSERHPNPSIFIFVKDKLMILI